MHTNDSWLRSNLTVHARLSCSKWYLREGDHGPRMRRMERGIEVLSELLTVTVEMVSCMGVLVTQHISIVKISRATRGSLLPFCIVDWILENRTPSNHLSRIPVVRRAHEGKRMSNYKLFTMTTACCLTTKYDSSKMWTLKSSTMVTLALGLSTGISFTTWDTIKMGILWYLKSGKRNRNDEWQEEINDLITSAENR